MPSPVTALATIRYAWVRLAGLERLLLHLAENRNPALTGTIILPVTRYDMSDSIFVEFSFSHPGLDLHGTIVVPKTEVITIVKTDLPEDMGKLGYSGRALTNATNLSPAEEEAPVTAA